MILERQLFVDMNLKIESTTKVHPSWLWKAEALKPESDSNYRPNPSALCGYCDFARICPDASVEPAKPWAVIEKQEF